MGDVIVCLLLLFSVWAAGLYIWKRKKGQDKCTGCSYAGVCHMTDDDRCAKGAGNSNCI